MSERTCMALAPSTRPGVKKGERCQALHAVHYIGAGQWVCFECWLRACGFIA